MGGWIVKPPVSTLPVGLRRGLGNTLVWGAPVYGELPGVGRTGCWSACNGCKTTGSAGHHVGWRDKKTSTLQECSAVLWIFYIVECFTQSRATGLKILLLLCILRFSKIESRTECNSAAWAIFALILNGTELIRRGLESSVLLLAE